MPSGHLANYTTLTDVTVGDYSTRTRSMIWDQVLGGLEDGDAVMVWNVPKPNLLGPF